MKVHDVHDPATALPVETVKRPRLPARAKFAPPWASAAPGDSLANTGELCGHGRRPGPGMGQGEVRGQDEAWACLGPGPRRV